MRTCLHALLGATSLCTLAGPAMAEELANTTAAAAADTEQPTVTVTGQREEYGVKSTSTATRTNTLLRNIPQAISVVSEAQIEDQSLRSVADLLLFVPGATPGTGEANRDQLTLRGNNTTADFFVDGLRDDAQYFRDFYNLDRVEVLKGPNAMIFGRGGGGGVINRVTKRPSFGNHQQLIISRDSEGGTRGTADIDLPVAGALGVRVNSVWEKADSFRQHSQIKRYGINPTVGFMAGPDTRLDLSYEYFHDRRTADRGIPSRSDGSALTVDSPLRGYDSTFFGDPDQSWSDADVQIASLAAEHRFSDALTIRNRTLLADYDKFYQNVFPSTAVTPAGTFTLGAYNSRNDRRNLISQTDLVWTGSIAGIDQTLLVGFEAARQSSRNQRLTGSIAGGNVVSVTDPTVERVVTYTRSASDADNRTRATVAAGYVQAQLRPSDFIEIVAGLRYDRFKLTVDDQRPTVATRSRSDSLLSPRLGLVLKPRDNLSFYGSYSRSYLPQSGDQFSGLTQATEALKPERFDNLEVGGKWEPGRGLLATVALYRLDRSNTQAANPNPLLPPLLTGGTRTRGLEIGLERSIGARWQVSAGYALQHSEIRRTTTAAPAGRKVALVPRHALSLWSKYQVSKPFAAGLGLLARSKSYASISNTVELPGYTRLDGALYYKLAPGIEAQLNVENLTGRDYFPTAHSDNNIAPGAPRTARLTLRADF
ncbi:TonB-dependent siderophore receptor [Sphingomonas sp. BN140010]|uniref:TonB-dependent siderophore receptor n=1 Tax=Sphingomonas arvum TaxID=2992113 RepID=A0ABT3JC83_9SPHN|nr:TonB-dependent siderophore receptor [Sphingomonas sp. BN140010]MCW3796375.1 TonB-dependent siderophore receptor [Sphingomonas sp. BN140010]